MHPNDAALLALIHGELPAGEAASIRSHVAGCAACRKRESALRTGDAEIGALLRLLDHPVPARAAPQVSRSRVFGARRAAIAASLAVFLAGAAAAAVPGTALNRWFRSQLGSAPPTAPHAASSAPVAAPLAPAQVAGGVEIPVPRALVLTFAEPQTHGVLTVRATSRANASLQAYGGDVAYQVGDGRIEIDNRNPADRYTLEVPAGLSRLTVIVGGRSVFDSAERPLAPGLDSIPLAPKGSR
jgi:anti-sigma factor RsiW